MMTSMTPAEIKSLIAEAKDAFGSANADKLSRLVERLAAALERAAAVIDMQAAVIEAHKTELAQRDAKTLALEKRLAEQAAEIAELKTRAGERVAELAYLKAQVFGPKSEKRRYEGDATEAAQAAAGTDDDENAADAAPTSAAEGAAAAQDAVAQALPAAAPAAGEAPSEATVAPEIANAGQAAAPTADPAEAAPAAGTAESQAVAAAAAEENRKARRRRARKLERERTPTASKRTIYSPELAHEIVHHKLPPDLDLPCPLCGDSVKSRGKSVESKEIDTGESAVTIRTHYQDKATCGCGALSFVMPGPVRAVPNTNFTPAFAARVIVDKFFAHLPLNTTTLGAFP